MGSDDPALHRAVIGEHNRDRRSGREQFVEVEDILTHENFNDPFKSNDIALVS